MAVGLEADARNASAPSAAGPPGSSSSAPLPCSIGGCVSSAATALHQALCVEHFFPHAYAALEHVEACHREVSYGGDANGPRESRLAEARSVLNDCSLQALHISMGSASLTNLDRGRLLDILLWAGELSESVRRSAKFSEPRHPATAKTATKSTRSSAASS
jgi:hypothetical protein